MKSSAVACSSIRCVVTDEERAELQARIAQNLIRARNTAGMSKAAVARDLGVHWNYVHSWEQGSTLPSAVYIVMLAQLLGVSTDYLLGLVDEQLPDPADEARDAKRKDAPTWSANETGGEARPDAAQAPPPPLTEDRVDAMADVLAAASRPRRDRSGRRRAGR